MGSYKKLKGLTGNYGFAVSSREYGGAYSRTVRIMLDRVPMFEQRSRRKRGYKVTEALVLRYMARYDIIEKARISAGLLATTE